MFLFEYQAKAMMREQGIPVLEGIVATSEQRALDAARELGEGPWVIKAQIHAGGRAEGRVGGSEDLRGIEFSNTVLGVGQTAARMLGKSLVTPQTTRQGETINAVYIEPEIRSELQVFLAILIDGERGEPVCLASVKGGSQVERDIFDDPKNLVRVPLGATNQVALSVGHEVASQLGLPSSSIGAFAELVQQLHGLFVARDLSLIEINPLAIRSNGSLVALDARVTVDDNALYRQPAMGALASRRDQSGAEERAAKNGFNFIRLDGNVGTLSSGAGLAMATLDAITHLGGRPANFLDVPPVLEVSRIKEAFLLVLSDPGIKSLIVNVFGAGIMRCDTIADGLLLAHLEQTVSIPLVMRLAGTNAPLALSRLERSGLDIQFAPNLASGAQMVIDAADSPPASRQTDSIVGRLTQWFTWTKEGPRS
ncbi:MAG: succinate--CoA ligase subunit beta [Proteobacteria bacterium TMED51]|jgi:succinyl-CoA synthetase beta subunit|nr:MAG: succinate--CoA ligase subunit beta [Proteobacteria bacterium TMED51]|tara:strand:- start:2416 stop:3687 length:1272 start_codon:yes stop_codon:yes gene_type:complete